MSYVNIDRQTMSITHKHSDKEVLHALSWIECVSNCAIVSLSHSRVFNDFTPAELALIYKNATGAKLNEYGTGLAQAVLNMARRLPETDIVKAEVLAQRTKVTDGDSAVYSYLKGSMEPKRHTGLFNPPAIRVEALETEVKAALVHSAEAAAILPGAKSAEVVEAGAGPALAPSSAGNARKAPSSGASTMPGEGTLTARIYARCNAYVQEKSCDHETARKEMAKVLIGEGVNASTARRQTAEWAKSCNNQG